MEGVFRIACRESQGEAEVLFLEGRLGLEDLPWLRRELGGLPPPGDRVLDLGGLGVLEAGAAAVLLRWQAEAAAAGRRLLWRGGPPPVRGILDLHEGLPDPRALRPAPCRRGMLDTLGRATLQLVRDCGEILAFTGALTRAVLRTLRRPSEMQWRGIGGLVNRAGMDALPIVLLINFLIGMIMSFQSAVQLLKFGATVYVADIVSLSMARELGPFMVAVIVAGRSGAGFAAELGTMKVQEEIDALRTLGFDPYTFLVLPRILALAFVVPLLTVLAVAVGTLGGMVTAVARLDMAPAAWWNEVHSTMSGWDLCGGLIKALVFGATIGSVACMRGLATRGGAEGVGRSTTSTVVTILFLLVLLDAVITALFFQFEIGM